MQIQVTFLGEKIRYMPLSERINGVLGYRLYPLVKCIDVNGVVVHKYDI